MIRALIISICFSLLVGCNTLSDAQKAEGQGKKVSYQAPFNGDLFEVIFARRVVVGCHASTPAGTSSYHQLGLMAPRWRTRPSSN